MHTPNRNKIAAIIVATIAIFLLIAFVPFANGENTSIKNTGPTSHVGATGSTGIIVKPKRTCPTIRAKKYNKYLRLRAQITGNKKQVRKLAKSKPVCIRQYKKLKKDIRKKRKICKRRAITTGASYYGYGDNSPANSAVGAYGTLHGYAFAELGMGSAMGGLTPNGWYYVNARGRSHSVRGQKRDIGAGGGPIMGYTRGIDLYEPFRNKLELYDNGVVNVSKNDCWAKLK